MDALATQKVLTEKLLEKEKRDINLKKDFPIKTVADLTKIDNKITDQNQTAYVIFFPILIKNYNECLIKTNRYRLVA